MEKTININLSIPVSLHKELKKLKDKNPKQTVTSFINIAIGEFIRTQKMFAK